MRRHWPRLLVAFVALLGLGELAVERVGAHVIVDAPNARRAVNALVADAPPDGVTPLRVEVGPPRASMAVWLVDSADPIATVFVLHGIRDSKRPMVGWGRRLAAAGYRAVLVDLRGHGGSTGDVLSYGVFDSRDLGQIADELARRGLLKGPIGVLGVSYGAATAIEWAGRDPRVKAVVAVAPFSSLRAVMPSYVARFAPHLSRLVPGVTFDRTLARAGTLGDFDPGEASPLNAIARAAGAHILLIHGRQDRHIPPWHSEALHARAPDHSELILVEGEDHDTMVGDRPGIVARRGLEWFGRWLAR